MSVSLATKLRWFDRGAAAFAQSFPEALSHLGPEPPPHYLCPTCPRFDAATKRYTVYLLPRCAVERKELTAEHVPAESLGGRELVLTCKRCNHTAGFLLDAEARKRENPLDALRGILPEPHPIRLRRGEAWASATIELEKDMYTLTLKNANDPKVQALLSMAAQHSTVPVTIEFVRDFHSPRRADVAWLRYAYLALFAVAGYRYIFRPGLGIVRQQIQEPKTEHIPTFLASLPEEQFWSERRIINVREPKWLQSIALQMGRHLVFLPKPGDIEFYTRLASAKRNVGHGSMSVDEWYEWPTEPFFGVPWALT